MPTDVARPISAAELRSTTLPLVRWRQGYALDQVDAAIDRCVRAIDARAHGLRPELTADDVTALRFAATKLREGYDQDAVDDLLDRVVAALR
ncbi:DivIVA domain-containing protein [Cellulomonas sp. SG140]|uniref:DivIVA domain-containing protein n=1 Tax=Cellulomonas sp. SG140 TaxID=2976536 RepID=UPI00399314D6